jgi:hypothetical protein
VIVVTVCRLLEGPFLSTIMIGSEEEAPLHVNVMGWPADKLLRSVLVNAMALATAAKAEVMRMVLKNCIVKKLSKLDLSLK